MGWFSVVAGQVLRCVPGSNFDVSTVQSMAISGANHHT